MCIFFFFNDTATTEIYTLSLHDALPIWAGGGATPGRRSRTSRSRRSPSPRAGSPSTDPSTTPSAARRPTPPRRGSRRRSEEHTSELQSRQYLVCRLLLEKKKNIEW